MGEDPESNLAHISDAEYRRTLEDALDKLATGVVIARGERVVYASQTQADLMGYTVEELRSTPVMALVDESERARIISRLKVRADGTDQSVSSYDLRIRHRSGRPLTLHVVNAPLPGPGVVLTLARDVTKERANERRSEQAHRMEAIGHFAAGIAHDFANYLTVVRLLGESLAQEDDPDERGRLLAELEKVTKGASRLTHELQTVAAAEPRRFVVLDVNIVVYEMAEMLRRLTGRHIELALHLEPGLPPAHVNAAQLQQVMMNLIVNASQSMPDGGRVTVRTSAEDAMVKLRVMDTGAGMEPDVLERAFEPLFTTHPETGSGMGLSIVYGIARQCGGTVEIESEPGRGTSVCVSLPEAKATLARSSSPESEPPSPTRQPRVMLVSAMSGEVGELVESGLRRAGFHVERATLEEAMARAELEVEALILDVEPPADVRDLVTAYRKGHPDGRVVFVSKPPELEDAEWESGQLALVPKPFSVAELAAAIGSSSREEDRSETTA